MRFFAFGVIRTMNILIVGNGFDLSHYLPTKYDHFMVAMQAIENWDESKGDMGFDDLFGSLYEKEGYFFDFTKAMYDTDKKKTIYINARKASKHKFIYVMKGSANEDKPYKITYSDNLRPER